MQDALNREGDGFHEALFNHVCQVSNIFLLNTVLDRGHHSVEGSALPETTVIKEIMKERGYKRRGEEKKKRLKKSRGQEARRKEEMRPNEKRDRREEERKGNEQRQGRMTEINTSDEKEEVNAAGKKGGDKKASFDNAD
ncbi:unnamed protein product [Pleuronectes platessa]|uniref:Uncharacterized protein n=1 Tax=Pleuronectes platessa TaxID=8262 RepID=A0A9N7U7J6_PLEPL|nr:unnamed protein product [Pleuronectes platessa]